MGSIDLSIEIPEGHAAYGNAGDFEVHFSRILQARRCFLMSYGPNLRGNQVVLHRINDEKKADAVREIASELGVEVRECISD